MELEKALDEWKRVGDAFECSESNMLLSQMEKFQQREITLISEKKDADILLSNMKTVS